MDDDDDDVDDGDDSDDDDGDDDKDDEDVCGNEDLCVLSVLVLRQTSQARIYFLLLLMMMMMFVAMKSLCISTERLPQNLLPVGDDDDEGGDDEDASVMSSCQVSLRSPVKSVSVSDPVHQVPTDWFAEAYF